MGKHKHPHVMRGRGRGFRWLRDHAAYAGDGCLKWPFGTDGKGYGSIGHESKLYKAHRMICILAHGQPPSPAFHAAHSCGRGNKGCVNPRHLSWKTPSENQQDSVRHGVYGKGVGWVGKLKKTQVSEIKALVGRLTNLELGTLYGVHPETIAKIRRGETWKEVA